MNFFDHLLFYMKLLNYLFCDMFGSVLECYELTHISWLSTPGIHAWVNRHCYPIGCVIKSAHQGICSCSPIVNFFKITFHYHSGPTEVEDCSLPPPNMAATKTGEQGKAWFSVL